MAEIKVGDYAPYFTGYRQHLTEPGMESVESRTLLSNGDYFLCIGHDPFQVAKQCQTLVSKQIPAGFNIVGASMGDPDILADFTKGANENLSVAGSRAGQDWGVLTEADRPQLQPALFVVTGGIVVFTQYGLDQSFPDFDKAIKTVQKIPRLI